MGYPPPSLSTELSVGNYDHYCWFIVGFHQHEQYSPESDFCPIPFIRQDGLHSKHIKSLVNARPI